MRQSSTAITIPLPSPPPLPSSESRLRSTQRKILVPSRAHDFCHPYPSSIFFAVFLPLSLFLPVLTPSVLLFPPSSSSLLSPSCSLFSKRLVSSLSQFQSLLPPRSAPAAAPAAAELLFRSSHALRRLTPFVRLASTSSFYHRSLSTKGTHTLQHTCTQKHPSSLCLSHRPSSAILLHPSSTLLASFCLYLS